MPKTVGVECKEMHEIILGISHKSNTRKSNPSEEQGPSTWPGSTCLVLDCFFSVFFSPLASSVLNLVYDLVYPWQGAQLPKSWMGTDPSSCGAGTTPITINNEALASPWRENGGQKVLPSPFFRQYPSSHIPKPKSRPPNRVSCPYLRMSLRHFRSLAAAKKKGEHFFRRLILLGFCAINVNCFLAKLCIPRTQRQEL